MPKKAKAKKRLNVKREKFKASVVVFIASFCTMVIELVAGRILAPYVGVSLYTWTSIIGVVLAGISVGAYLGGCLADRYPRSSTLGWLLFLSGLAAFLVSPLTNIIGPAHLHTSMMVRILLISAVIFFVPSCLLGMISPVVVKLALDSLQRTGNVVGKIYAFSTLGSILGTFATGFFLISWVGTRNVLFTMGAILLVSAPLFGGFFIRKKAVVLFSLIFIPVLWGFYGYGFKAPLDKETIFYKESNYYTIQLKKLPWDGKRQLVALFLDGDNITHSCSDVNDPFFLILPYIQAYAEFLTWQVSKKESFDVLMIGGGGYTFPRFIEARYPKASIDVVEIDPEVTGVAFRYLGVPKATRIRTFNVDARWFIMNHHEKEKYDFVFVDAFNDLSIPYHLSTKEFIMQLKSLLKPNGLLVANVVDSPKKGRFLSSYTRTAQEVFGKGKVHIITLGASEDSSGIANFVVVASAQTLDMDDFVRTIMTMRGRMTSHVMPRDQMEQYLKERSPVILTDDYAPVDNLIAPAFEELYGVSLSLSSAPKHRRNGQK